MSTTTEQEKLSVAVTETFVAYENARSALCESVGAEFVPQGAGPIEVPA